jgi:hypothetical protein
MTMNATREDGLRKALDDYDAMSENGPIGDVMRDIRAVAQRCGWRANTCGSVVEWSRRYLARRAMRGA